MAPERPLVLLVLLLVQPVALASLVRPQPVLPQEPPLVQQPEPQRALPPLVRRVLL